MPNTQVSEDLNGAQFALFRHAEAKPATAGEDDKARPLTALGRAAARQVAQQMQGLGLVPKRALVSAATRTRGTWDAAQEILSDCQPRFHDHLYHAPATVLWNSLTEAMRPDSPVVLVGHNPGISSLAFRLTHGQVGSLSLAMVVWFEIVDGTPHCRHVLRPT